MGSDAYRRSGRGGAGNFYSKSDVAEIEKRAAMAAGSKDDLEAQKPAPAPADLNPLTSHPVQQQQQQQYARLGRGGAGNMIVVDGSLSATDPNTSSTAGPTPPSPTSPGGSRRVSSGGGGAHSGRGGTGNWVSSSTQQERAGEQGWEQGGGQGQGQEETWMERERRARLDRETTDAGLARDVRAALPQMPRRVYHLHDGAAHAGRRRVRSGSEVFGEI